MNDKVEAEYRIEGLRRELDKTKGELKAAATKTKALQAEVRQWQGLYRDLEKGRREERTVQIQDPQRAGAFTEAVARSTGSVGKSSWAPFTERL